MKTLSDYGQAARNNAAAPARDAGATEQDQTSSPAGPFRVEMASDEIGKTAEPALKDEGSGDQDRA